MGINIIFGNEESESFEIVRVGVVSSINRREATAKVYFEHHDNSVSHDLPVVVKNTMEIKDYWMPDINEQVICLFSGPSVGYIFGSTYSDVDKPISDMSEFGKNKRGLYIDSNNFIEWDREEGQFIISASKPIRLKGRIETE